MKPVGKGLAEGLGVKFKVMKGEVLKLRVGGNGEGAVGTPRGRTRERLF